MKQKMVWTLFFRSSSDRILGLITFDYVQMILVFSFGQATVERGLSKNKMLLVENSNRESLIAQQLI